MYFLLLYFVMQEFWRFFGLKIWFWSHLDIYQLTFESNIFSIYHPSRKRFFHFIFYYFISGSMLLLDKLIKWSQITYFRRQHPFFLTLGGTRFHSNISLKINWFFYFLLLGSQRGIFIEHFWIYWIFLKIDEELDYVSM